MFHVKPQTATAFAVFGLGRFGTSIVEHLAAAGVEVLAADRDLARVEAVANLVDSAVAGDASDPEFLERVAVAHFDVVVFAMGEEFEASILATMTAKEMGCPRVVVKALDARQAKILRRIGADSVVLPEVEMGAKVAKSLVNPNIVDVLDQVAGIGIAERHPDAAWVGQTLAEADIRRSAKVEVIALIRDGRPQVPVNSDTILREDDILLTLESPK
ncbi:potassium channel family protein [Lacticaseibacillus parakribbianus]|uniref:potassium channel family protein n=1 Tax=Lacticaseibacillus parakribbianus TaxID=2970927 RepID=UPI0021CB9449|nr:TrkA family potassium uptake protein [Lacticaseibacillus parakribbianus]